jgi:hypothetical protein
MRSADCQLTTFPGFARVLELLTILFLSVHMLAMNIASAGPAVAVWLHWQGVQNAVRGSLDRQLMWLSIMGFLVGMLMGGLILFVSPNDGLMPALRRFPASAYWFAGAELIFSLACMLIGVTVWNRVSRWWLALLAFATTTNLLYHFPPLMAMIGELASNPHWTDIEIINRSDVLKLMRHGDVLALTFHFGMSSFAVSSIALLKLLSRRTPEIGPEETRITRGASWLALAATLLQVPIGIWLLTSLDDPARSTLMGSSLLASVAFIAALVLSIKLLQCLFAIALGQANRENLARVFSLVCGVVLLMTTSLRLSRESPPQIPATKTAWAMSTEAVRIFVDLSSVTSPAPFWRLRLNRRATCLL